MRRARVRAIVRKVFDFNRFEQTRRHPHTRSPHTHVHIIACQTTLLWPLLLGITGRIYCPDTHKRDTHSQRGLDSNTCHLAFAQAPHVSRSGDLCIVSRPSMSAWCTHSSGERFSLCLYNTHATCARHYACE